MTACIYEVNVRTNKLRVKYRSLMSLLGLMYRIKSKMYRINSTGVGCVTLECACTTQVGGFYLRAIRIVHKTTTKYYFQSFTSTRPIIYSN